MSKWFWIKFTGAIGHMVEERFVSAVKADLISRGCGELESEEASPAPKFFLDPGGFAIVDEPYERLGEIDGLEVSVVSHAVGEFVQRAKALKERDGGYVKLHSFYCCLVMTPAQRDRLVEELVRIDEWATARATRHFEKWKARHR